MAHNTRTRVRVLFGITLILFAVQMPVIYFMKREPYPSLTMPSFAGHPDQNDQIEVRSGTAEVRFANGSIQTIELKQLLPSTKVRTGHVLRAFENESFLAKPETVNWLESRVQALYPDQPIKAVDIIWQNAHYDVFDTSLDPKEFTPDSIIHVEFDGAK